MINYFGLIKTLGIVVLSDLILVRKKMVIFILFSYLSSVGWIVVVVNQFFDFFFFFEKITNWRFSGFM